MDSVYESIRFEYVYVKGRENVVADALSRRSDHYPSGESIAREKETERKKQLAVWQVKDITEREKQELAAVSVVMVKEIRERVKAALSTDLEKNKILKLLTKQRKSQEEETMSKKYLEDGWSVSNGVLFRYNRLYVPDDRMLRSDLLVEAHDSKLNGHLGTEKTRAQLTKYYYWPRMGDEVKEYVKSCLNCSSIKHSTQRSAGLLQPLPIPEQKWEQVTIDFITKLPKTQKKGNTVLVVMTDKLTKMIHIAACKEEVSAAEVAEIFFREVVRLHGIPQSIVSDRDTRFTSNFWKALWTLLGTKLKMSTAYHPQTDGQTEVTNKTVETMIRAYVNHQLNDWDEYLYHLEIAYNNSEHRSTGFSPFFLNAGQHPNFPLSAAAKESKTITTRTKNESANEFVRRVSLTIEEAKKRLKTAQEQQKKQADKHRREVSYKVGDRVMLTTENLSSHNSKLRARYIGPYPIKRVLSDVLVELELPRSMSRHHPRFHIEKLKPFNDDSTRFPTRRQINRPVAEVIDKIKEYEVQEILDERETKEKGLEYRVLWLGYPVEDATWERAGYLKNSPEIIKEWKRKKQNQTITHRKEREKRKKKQKKKLHIHTDKQQKKTKRRRNTRRTTKEQKNQKKRKEENGTEDMSKLG